MEKRFLGNLIYSLWDVFLIRLTFLTSSLRSNMSLRIQGCRPGANLRTSGPCHFKARHAGSIQIGENAVMLANWRTNRVGVSGPVLLTTMGQGQICIGNHFGASAIVISSRSQVIIGDHVMLGGNVRIFDHDFHSMNFLLRRSAEDAKNCVTRPVTLGNDVFVGADSLILKGVSLGNRVVVGAGSVVTKSFSDDAIVAGNPAREISVKSSPAK